jgi:glycosyltransferase involved in cell wall biosynthesis
MVDGGVAIATGRLVEQLLTRGHWVTVFSTLPAALTEQQKHQIPAPTTYFALYDGLPEDPQQAPKAVGEFEHRVKAIHKEKPFDVLLAYFVYPGGYLAAQLGEYLGVPVVCSCRGNDISKDMFIRPAVIAAVLQQTTHLIFVSESLLHMADTLVPCRQKATVIANAVDAARFVPAAPSLAARMAKVVVGTSGIFRWKKGLDVFLALSHTLCAAYRDVQILMAGYGLDATIDQHIKTVIEQHGLQERIEVTGALPHAEMVRALQRMDIYVNTSYQEGMPNGVLEAMACALPVVATDADGTPELVQDGMTGYLCKMGDLETLLNRCQRLITQPALRQGFGHAGRRRVQHYFPPSRETAAIEAVLHQVQRDVHTTSATWPRLH